MFVNNSPGNLVKNLKKEYGKDIWICGGANIISQLMHEALIDMFHISVIPMILGNGIRLIDNINSEMKLDFVQVRSGNEIIELIYEHRSNGR